MGLFDKSMMKIYDMILKLKNNKSQKEAGTSKALSKSYDKCSSEHIKPMITHLNQLINKSSVKI